MGVLELFNEINSGTKISNEKSKWYDYLIGEETPIMKRFMMLLIIPIMVLSGCGNNTDPPMDQEEQGNEIEAEAQLIEEFRDLMEEAEFPKEVVAYVDHNIKKMETETANQMLFELTDYLSNFFIDNFSVWSNIEKLNAYYKYPQGINLEEITEADLKEFYNDLIDSGYKLEAIEGMINPIVDYRWVAKYNNYISKDLIDYYELCAIESDELSAKDAGLTITWNELGNRVLAAESYLSKYPHSLASEEAAFRYEQYLWMYLLGLNNTPIVDWETNKVIDEVLNSYHQFIEDHRDTATADALANYLEILSDLNYVIPYDNEEEFLNFDKSLEELVNNTVSIYTQQR